MNTVLVWNQIMVYVTFATDRMRMDQSFLIKKRSIPLALCVARKAAENFLEKSPDVLSLTFHDRITVRVEVPHKKEIVCIEKKEDINFSWDYLPGAIVLTRDEIKKNWPRTAEQMHERGFEYAVIWPNELKKRGHYFCQPSVIPGGKFRVLKNGVLTKHRPHVLPLPPFSVL